MSKPKRNEPCPCGSGKKYKKCCGASNVTELSPAIYDQELIDFYNGFMRYSLEINEASMSERLASYIHSFNMDDDEGTEALIVYLTSWVILHDPYLEDGKTLLEQYYHLKQSSLRKRSKDIIATWMQAKPSIYEVLSADDTNGVTHVEDVLSKETFNIKLDVDEEPHEVGNIIIGIRLPFTSYHTFCFGEIELPSDTREDLIDIAEPYIDGEQGLINTFPNFLAQLMVPENALEWDRLDHEMVADLFRAHMVNKDYEMNIINTGISIWNRYCNEKDPTFKKLGPHAAALEYLITEALLPDVQITQKQLAKEYDTTTGSISTNYRKLIEHVDEMTLHSEMDEDDSDIQIVNPTMPTFNMEKEMRTIEKMLSEQEFDTMEEVNDFLNQLLKDGIPEVTSDNPREMAMDKIYDAEIATGSKRKKHIQEALDLYPNTPDAYRLLAQDANTLEERMALLMKAIEAGEKDLGNDFFKENKGHFWGLIETRPYMRAKYEYALELHMMDDIDTAIPHYEQLLELNPNDNLGVRYELLTAYLDIGQLNKAQQLIESYQEDSTAGLLYQAVLVNYQIEGITNKTKSLLGRAKKSNPHVIDYLTTKKIPHTKYDSIQWGGKSEAIDYAQKNAHLWQDDEMQDLLKKI